MCPVGCVRFEIHGGSRPHEGGTFSSSSKFTLTLDREREIRPLPERAGGVLGPLSIVLSLRGTESLIFRLPMEDASDGVSTTLVMVSPWCASAECVPGGPAAARTMTQLTERRSERD